MSQKMRLFVGITSTQYEDAHKTPTWQIYHQSVVARPAHGRALQLGRLPLEHLLEAFAMRRTEFS